jgi:hypothetical protein
MNEWRLYVGTKSTGIVVAPDEKYPTMYRIHWPDLDRPPTWSILLGQKTLLWEV